MDSIELKIKRSDWLYILATGVTFSTLLALLVYLIVHQDLISGMLFGALLGFMITLFSLLFITLMNHQILPHLPKIFWLPLAIIFSFSSGFVGTSLSVWIANLGGLVLIDLFLTHTILLASAIGLLTYIVGAILYRFVKMRNHKEKSDQSYLQSRLVSLETQLNSHFLFNALNSIAELIYQNPKKAEKALLTLSTFLRHTMEEKALISLQEEIRNLQEYIALENIRFEGRISLHLPKDIPSLMVPKFSLQLLVENAIKHGMIPNQPLTITLISDSKQRTITLCNDGKPMQYTTFSTGLGNLNQRLALLCEGKLAIVRTDPPTFTIHLGVCHENTHR